MNPYVRAAKKFPKVKNQAKERLDKRKEVTTPPQVVTPKK